MKRTERAPREFALTQARKHLTHLERLLRPGESAVIRKHGRPYAEIRLVVEARESESSYEVIDRALARLPRATGSSRDLSGNVKSLLYGKVRRGR